MKKMMVTLLALVLCLSALSLTAFAQEAQIAKDNSDSTASINFKEGDFGIVPELPEYPDPEDPTKPGKPPVGFEGFLDTKDIEFGTHKITGIEQHINGYSTDGETVDPDSEKVRTSVIVQDASGTLEPKKWIVSVQVNETFKGSDGSLTLSGALDLNKENAIYGQGQNSPSANSAKLAFTNDPSKQKYEKFDVFKANKAGSAGLWATNWKADLTVEGGTATVQEHTAKLLWTITPGVATD